MPKSMTPHRWLAAGLLAAAGIALPAQAADKAELFKCVDVAGATSIQSEPCPKGSTQVWRRAADAEPAPTAEQAAQAQARRARDEQAVRDLSAEVERKLRPQPPKADAEPADAPVSSEPATPEGPDRCERAQDFSRELRDKPWLGLGEDQTRRLHAWVAAECQAVGRED
jgi:hypothetical protein